MGKDQLLRILQLPFSGLAWAIAKVGVNRISQRGSNTSSETIQKSRAAWSWPIIALGNIVFASRTPKLQVLHRKDWLDWESRLRQTLLNESVQIDSNQLVCRKIVGHTLAELLGGLADKSKHEQLIELAAKSLAQFHSTPTQLGDQEVLLSHGDAAAYNVLIDETKNTAVWFDFDLRHELQQPATVRQADDLRSLIFSIARLLEPGEIYNYVKLVKTNYQRRDIWQQLVKQVSQSRFAFDIFHLAQVRRVRSGKDLKTSHFQLDELVTDAIKNANTVEQSHSNIDPLK